MWDPSKYLRFSDHRGRPVHDLLARIDEVPARRVVDLGCGAGNLTHLLSRRWPGAVLEATDSSPEMVESARARGIDARLQDVRDWAPQPDTDVVLCNAVLQWVPDHVDLLRQWLPLLPEGASFAFQVPGNFDSPSHVLIRELAVTPEWKDQIGARLLAEPVLAPAGYADVVADLGLDVDAWESTYLHRLRGEDPVLEWISGTALRPVRAALADEAWGRFRAQLASRLRDAYPQRSDGTTWFPFRRVLVVARR